MLPQPKETLLYEAMSRRFGFPLHLQILAGMLVGASSGLAANEILGSSERLQQFVRGFAYPAGQIFLRLIFMVVIPLVFSALVLGVAELGDLRRLGRVGLKTLAFTIVLSAISVMVGVAMVNLVRPGEGFAEAER